MNESQTDNNAPVEYWFELPLQTDFAGFETQLEQFISTYTEPGLAKVDSSTYRSALGERLGMGMQPSRKGDARNYSIRLYFYNTISLMTEDAEVIFFVSYLGLNRLLLTIPPGFVKAYKFAKSFVSRCKELWLERSTSNPQQVYQQDAAAPPQPTGINFSNINVGGNFTANLFDVAGGNQTTTTTTTTITQQGSPLSAAATHHAQRAQDLIEHIQRHQTLLRQYEERRAVEDDPRRLLELDLNIAREKDTLKGYEAELKLLSSFNE